MKTLLVFAFACASLCAHGETSSLSADRPPHRIFNWSRGWNTKKVKVQGHDRAQITKKVRNLKGYDYYGHANRPSYFRMMGKAINGDKYFRFR
jgi:hypothetical protein